MDLVLKIRVLDDKQSIVFAFYFESKDVETDNVSLQCCGI
jgi:hypothetical protein